MKDNSSFYGTEFPRPGSVMYNRIYADERVRERSRKRQKRYNKYIMIPLYKIGLLPLFGLGRLLLILTTKGRKKW